MHDEPMRQARGFTLLEVMVVVAIVGLMATLAVPNLNEMNRRFKARAVTSELNALIRYGRSEAMRTNSRYMIVINVGSSTSASDDKAALYANAPQVAPWQDVSTFTTAQLDGYSGTTPVAAPAPLTFVRTVSFAGEVGFGPSSGYPVAFDKPYNAAPRASACTFCGSNRGAIYLEPDGTFTFSQDGKTGLTDEVASIAISPQKDWGTPKLGRIYAILLVAKTGVARVISK